MGLYYKKFLKSPVLLKQILWNGPLINFCLEAHFIKFYEESILLNDFWKGILNRSQILPGSNPVVLYGLFMYILKKLYFFLNIKWYKY